MYVCVCMYVCECVCECVSLNVNMLARMYVTVHFIIIIRCFYFVRDFRWKIGNVEEMRGEVKLTRRMKEKN